MGSLGGMLGGGPSKGGMGRPGSLLQRASAARMQPVVDANVGHWVENPATSQWDHPQMMFVLDNPAPVPGAAPTGAVPAMQNAVQTAAAAAPAPQAEFPVPQTVIGTLGETPGANGAAGTASTTPGSRRQRRAPSRGRAATLLGGGEGGEVLGT